jgi:hypothetical protein
MDGESTIVMGFASNLDAAHFLPFLTSLRSTGYKGRVVVFTANLPPGSEEELEPWVDDLVSVDDRYMTQLPRALTGVLRRLQRARGLRRHYVRVYPWAARIARLTRGPSGLRQMEFELQGVQALRYRHYLEYLAALPGASAVMVTDLRDVLFQSDPFATPISGVEVFLEDPTTTVGSPGFNRRWLADLYGRGWVEDNARQTVSCSGVTIGSREPMVAYLRGMVDELEGRLAPLGPRDQAAHNRLVLSGVVPQLTKVANGTGRVLTMGAMEPSSLIDGVVRNADGSVPAVLHQYDRHPDLTAQLLSLHGWSPRGLPREHSDD